MRSILMILLSTSHRKQQLQLAPELESDLLDIANWKLLISIL